MEIPGTSQVPQLNRGSIKKPKSHEKQNKNRTGDQVMVDDGTVVQLVQNEDLASTESLDLEGNDSDVEITFNASTKRVGAKVKDAMAHPDVITKQGPIFEVASGMSTATSMSSKGDIEEEIEAIYSWVPELSNHFTIIKKIGEGTFSSVYQAKLRHYPDINECFALKHIIPTSHPSRIENELRCLLRIGGKDNVMGVKLCFRNRDHVIIVMPYFPHDRFQDYLQELPFEEAKEYMKNLLIALRRVHQFNVIHRDVKPSNFLYNRHTKEFALVDFGLATGPMLSDPAKESRDRRAARTTSSHGSGAKASELGRACTRTPLSPSKQATVHASGDYKKKDSGNKPATAEPRKHFVRSFSSACTQLEGQCDCYGKPIICELCISRNNQVAPRAGTAGFRAPEVLMKSPEQDTAVDMWSAGVIFLSLLSGRYPFFRAQDDLGFLAQIISVLGSKACIQAATAFGKLLTLNESIPSVDLEAACLKLRESQIAASSYESDAVLMSWSQLTSQAFDLLQKLLDPNPKTRITADAALQHPFFTQEAKMDTCT